MESDKKILKYLKSACLERMQALKGVDRKKKPTVKPSVGRRGGETALSNSKQSNYTS